MLAQRLGVWVPLDEVPEVWAGVVGVFRDYGYRRLRSRARLKFLVADWGVARFREVLEGEYLRPEADRRPGPGAAGAPDRPHWSAPAARRPVLRRRRRRSPDGSAGRCWPRWPTSPRRTAAAGCASRRTRSSWCWTSPRPTCRSVTAQLRDDRPGRRRRRPGGAARWPAPASSSASSPSSRPRPGRPRSCTGSRSACGDLDTDITINVNGCPNACARTQVADIGLKGQLVPGPDGALVEGFQIHLGGGLTMAAGPERRLRAQAAGSQDHGRGAARRTSNG